MENNLPKVLLDSNVLVSAFLFGGKPEEVFNLILDKEAVGYTSAYILLEIQETFTKKSHLPLSRQIEFQTKAKKRFIQVYPKEEINVSRDKDDNKVIEAAVEGECDYIVTGDKDLLTLKKFRTIKIVTPKEFLEIYKKA